MTVLYQIGCQQTMLSQKMLNVVYYETAAELSAAQLQELADGIRLAWSGDIAATTMSDEWSLNGILSRRVDIAGLLGDDWPFTAGSLVGLNVNNPVPAQIALLVSGKGITVRPNRVRSYICGWTDSGMGADGLFTSGQLVRVVDWAQTMDSISLTGDTAVRQAAKWASPSATHVVDWNPITTYQATANPATQRRRRIGVGG